MRVAASSSVSSHTAPAGPQRADGIELRPVVGAPAGHFPGRNEAVECGLVGQFLAAAAGVDQGSRRGQRHLGVMSKNQLDSLRAFRLA